MKRALIGLLIVLAIGAGAGAYYIRRGGPDVQVNTSPITRGDIVDTVGASGTLQAVTTVQVGSQVSGNISFLGADFNSIVKKGQVIARLDPSLFEAQLQQARANLQQTRANLTKSESDLNRSKVMLTDAQQKYARAKELAAKSLLPQSDLDAAKIAVDSAQATLSSAEATVSQSQAAVNQSQASLNQNQVNLDHTVIEAPIDGIIIQRSVDVGQTVAASMQAPTLFVIAADLTKMQVNANIDEADVGRIRPGQHVTFKVDAYPTDTFEGTVSQIRLQPVVVQNVTTYGTVIDVPNAQLKLKPGMTANVKVEIAKKGDTLRVPNTALRFRPSADVFAALNQAAPPETIGSGRGGRGNGVRGGNRNGGAGDGSTALPSASASTGGTGNTGTTGIHCGALRWAFQCRERTAGRWRRTGIRSGTDAGTVQGDVDRRSEAVHRPDEGSRSGHQRLREGAPDQRQSAQRGETEERRVGTDHRCIVRAAPVSRVARPRLAVHGSSTQAGEPPPRDYRRHQHRAAQRRAAAEHGSGHQRHRRRDQDDGDREPERQPAAAGRTRRARPLGRTLMSTVISVRNLVKTYVVGEVQVKALRGINLDVQRGEFLAVSGTSGSGKSTFMHIVGCLDKPTSGQYLLDDQDVSRMSKDALAAVRNKKIGFVFQGFNLLSRTSALDNVELPLLYGHSTLKTADRHKRATEMLELVGLGNRADHHPNQLSGGQQQRVAIARALINNPSILLADEPTGNLDTRTSIEVMGIFQRLNQERGITVVLITHEMDIAEYGTRTVTFRDGQVVADKAVARRRQAQDELAALPRAEAV